MRLVALEKEQDQIVNSLFDAFRQGEMAAIQFNDILNKNSTSTEAKRDLLNTDELNEAKGELYEIYDDGGSDDDGEDRYALVDLKKNQINPQVFATSDGYDCNKNLVQDNIEDSSEIAREELKAEWNKQWNETWWRQKEMNAQNNVNP